MGDDLCARGRGDTPRAVVDPCRQVTEEENARETRTQRGRTRKEAGGVSAAAKRASFSFSASAHSRLNFACTPDTSPSTVLLSSQSGSGPFVMGKPSTRGLMGLRRLARSLACEWRRLNQRSSPEIPAAEEEEAAPAARAPPVTEAGRRTTPPPEMAAGADCSRRRSRSRCGSSAAAAAAASRRAARGGAGWSGGERRLSRKQETR